MKSTYPKFSKKHNKENDDNQIDNFSKIMLPLIKTSNNLVYLSIKFVNDTIIAPNLFEFINNFKFLEYLWLHHIIFNSNFLLKLCTLKSLDLKDCNKIDFINDLFLKIINLSMIYIGIDKDKNIILPEL